MAEMILLETEDGCIELVGFEDGGYWLASDPILMTPEIALELAVKLTEWAKAQKKG